MKTKKIIGLLVACGGAIASFAAAAALYTKDVDPVGFGIGAQYHGQDGSISYKIDGKNSGTINPHYLRADGTNGGAGLGAEDNEGNRFTQVEYVFPLTAVYGKQGQDYVMGNFKVELENISEELQEHSHIWVELKDFGDEYYTAEAAHTMDNSIKWGSSAANVKFMNSDVLLDDDSYSIDKDIAVETSGTQKVHVYVKLDASVIADGAMLALAETTPFTIKATWGAPSASYEGAFAIGDGSGWAQDDLYAMVPNMKASSFEWYYKGVTGWTLGKAVKHVNVGDDVWSANVSEEHPNAELDASKTYNVVWNGEGSGIAYYQEQA